MILARVWLAGLTILLTLTSIEVPRTRAQVSMRFSIVVAAIGVVLTRLEDVTRLARRVALCTDAG